MKYIVDITKPPIPPPAPPCRTFKEIGMFFPVRVETTESKALTDRYKEDQEAWLNYIKKYSIMMSEKEYCYKLQFNNLKTQQENNIDFEI